MSLRIIYHYQEHWRNLLLIFLLINFSNSLSAKVTGSYPFLLFLLITVKGLSNFFTEEPKEKNMESITDKIINKSKHAGIILVLFIILTLPQLNKVVLKFLPKMAIEGPQMSVLGNILKGVLLALIYMGVSFLL